MILPAQTIRKLCLPYPLSGAAERRFSGPPMITPFEEKRQIYGLSGGLSECGYDITIDQSVVLYPVTLKYLAINALGMKRPSFVLASSIERFMLPDNVCFRVVDKSTWIRRGLTVHNTVAEPGWCGWLTLELCNQGSDIIYIRERMPIAQVIFQRLEDPTDQPYTGKYQHAPRGPQPALFGA